MKDLIALSIDISIDILCWYAPSFGVADFKYDPEVHGHEKG